MPAKKTPKWKPVPEEMKQLFAALLPAVPRAEPRQMFGCPCAFSNGQMFAGLFEDTLFVRLAEADRAALLNQPGAQLFDPMRGRPMREYVVVPSAIHTSEAELVQWMQKAAAYVETLPPKKKAVRPKRLAKKE